MDVSRFKDGRAHFRNSGMKELNMDWIDLVLKLTERFCASFQNENHDFEEMGTLPWVHKIFNFALLYFIQTVGLLDNSR